MNNQLLERMQDLCGLVEVSDVERALLLGPNYEEEIRSMKLTKPYYFNIDGRYLDRGMTWNWANDWENRAVKMFQFMYDPKTDTFTENPDKESVRHF